LEKHGDTGIGIEQKDEYVFPSPFGGPISMQKQAAIPVRWMVSRNPLSSHEVNSKTGSILFVLIIR